MTALYYEYRNAMTVEARRTVVKKADDLFNQRAIVIPLYESGASFLVDPRLQGFVFRSVRGFADYRYVSIKSSKGL